MVTLTRRSIFAGAMGCVSRPAVGSARDLDRMIIEQMKQAGIPGLSAAVARRGHTVYAAGHGFADLEQSRHVTTETMFHIASITKTVTATAIVQLAGRGLLKLDEPVTPHLDFALAHPRFPDRPITFRQLLTHTSGISDVRYYEVDFRRRGADAVQTLGDFLRQYLAPGGRHFSPEGSFAAAPGAAWDYCNVGYGLLGYLAGRIGGDDMRLSSRERVFAPLGMRRTSWTLSDTPKALRAIPYEFEGGRFKRVEPVGFPDWPAGMIRSSAAELVRFVGAAANGGAPILAQDLQSEMLTMTRPAGLPSWLSGQGLGWQESPLNGAPLINHWGGDPGVFSVAYLDPRNHTAAVILTNTNATDASKTAVKAIAARLLAFAA